MSDPLSGDGHPDQTVSWLPYAAQWIEDDDVAAVSDVLRSDFLTQGPAIDRFEAALARATGARFAVVVSSGTAALHLAARALGVDTRHAGVTSPITFAASANCFLYCGAVAAFADVDPVTGLMTTGELDAKLSGLAAAGASARVVVAVSLAGHVPDLSGLEAICRKHGCDLVEDAAHSLGAVYRVAGKSFLSGSCAHSRAAILSFHPVKHICAGEGGAVLTNDAALAAHIRRLRTHGIEKPATPPAGEGGWFQEQVELGYHYRLTDMQAALGESQLRKLPRFLDRRRTLARRYAAELAREPFPRVLSAPRFDPDHGYHLFIVHFRNPDLRRAAYDFLAASRIRTQVHYIPVNRHPHYQKLFGDIRLPGADSYYAACLSLPLFPKMSDADQTRVLESLSEFARSHG